jgi:hypothetical protein
MRRAKKDFQKTVSESLEIDDKPKVEDAGQGLSLDADAVHRGQPAAEKNAAEPGEVPLLKPIRDVPGDEEPRERLVGIV